MVAKNKGGRPPAFDKAKLNELQQLMRLAPTLKDTAAFFDVHIDTIEQTIKRHWNLSFPEFRERNMVHTRLSLIRKAIQEATKERPNTAMLIFALKNLCDWKDKADTAPVDDEDRKIILAYEIKPKEPVKDAVV